MEKNISNAFTYMFKDNDWKFKFVVLALLQIPICILFGITLSNGLDKIPTFFLTANIGALIFLAILSVFVMGVASGYISKTMNNIVNSPCDSEFLLPNWEDGFSKYFGYFCRLACASFLFSLVTSLILLIPIVSIVIIFLVNLMTPVLMAIFAKDFKLNALLNWKTAFAIIKEDKVTYFKSLILMIATGFVVNIILALGVVMLLFFHQAALFVVVPVSLFITAYVQLIYAYLVGILGRNSILSAVVIPT